MSELLQIQSKSIETHDVATDLTPPFGKVITTIGVALESDDSFIRNPAFEILEEMVEIPSGDVLIGDKLKKVQVDKFSMGKFPVTNAQYLRFVEATNYAPPNYWIDGKYPDFMGDHPVTSIDCTSAEAYASWKNARLPSFTEWLRTASSDDDRKFPWGNDLDRPRCNSAEVGAGMTTPVGLFSDGVSAFGCYDLVGNVYEWTSTFYDEKEYFRVVCGGSWYYNHDRSHCRSYDFFSVNYTENIIGFRVSRTE